MMNSYNRYAVLEEMDAEQDSDFSDSDQQSIFPDQDSVFYTGSDGECDMLPQKLATEYDMYGQGEEEEDGDDVSETSTVEYNQECFVEFQHKVLALCEQLWPDENSAIKVERLRGGSYNRIVGITIHPEPTVVSEPPKTSSTFFQLLKSPSKLFAKLKAFVRPAVDHRAPVHYILRCPRENEDQNNIVREIALFRLADNSLPSFTVPTAIKFDTSSDNLLGAPFVISKRLPGANLDNLWPDLNHQQKLSLAVQIGKVYNELSRSPFKFVGMVDPASVSNDKNKQKDIRVFEPQFNRRVKVENEWKDVTENLRTLAPRQTPLEVLRSRFQKWKVWDFNPNFSDGESIPYTKLARIVEEQQTQHSTWAPERCFYLAHNDLYPRNIMARIVNDHQVEVTGILDWDLATIAPAVVAFQPPWWLWKNELYQADESNWSGAIRAPEDYNTVTPKEKQIREAFEARAGFKVTEFINNPDSHLAKKLWRWACGGFPENEQIELARDVVNSWEAGKK